MNLNPQSKPYQYQDVSDDGAVTNSFFAVIFEIFKTIFIVAILALIFRIFIIQPFIVDGESMRPTLANNDYLLIDKISYRFREPERGEVVVFHYPKDPRYNYIKRIIALPGERIEIIANKITIFNSEHPAGFSVSEEYLGELRDVSLVPKNKKINLTVPTDSYFVLGDNRAHSSDSRDWGVLPNEDLIGRTFIRLFPINNFKVLAHLDY